MRHEKVVPDLSEMVVQADVLAVLIGMSERRVRELRDEGVIPDNGAGRYVLGVAISAYCAHIRPSQGLSARGGSASAGLTSEREGLAKAQRLAQEHKNAVATGEYVLAIDVERTWSDFLRKVRSQVLAVPSRVRQIVPTLTAHDAGLIDRELRDVLTGLADGDLE